MDYMIDYMDARYHLSVCERMMRDYGEYPDKRFLVGVINEAARCVSRLIRSFLIYDGIKGGLNEFLNVASKYLDRGIIDNLLKVLEIEKAQRVSPVEFSRKNQIILLIDGKYRVLKISRLVEFLKSVRDGVDKFPGKYRQI
jgi:hypothetical protein